MLPSRISLAGCLGLALVAAGVVTSSASAATQRYAAPSGSGTACTAAGPCSLKQAVEAADDGDEVIVAPGDYPLTGLHAMDVTIHGIAGQPRPRLLFDNAPTPALQIRYTTLSDVEVDQAPSAQGILLGVTDSTLDRVIARGSAQPGWQTVWTGGTVTIRDSIIVAPAHNGVAIRTEAAGTSVSVTLRNVTAIAAEPGGEAIQEHAGGAAGYASLLAENVIARGSSGGLDVWTDNSGATATLTVRHSNWVGSSASGTHASIADGGGNQTAAPVFVSAAGGDYHEAPGSPTVDAGLSGFLNGDFDVDGDPRTIGTVDIGADELLVTPGATTGPASALTADSATLGGDVEAHGVPTSYWFEYGTTTAYGTTTPAADAGAGTSAVAAAASLAGLSPATTYHYRLVAANSGVTTHGADQTFTTVALPAPVVAPTPAPGFAGVRLVSRKLSYRGRFVTLKLRCPAGTAGRCTGTTKLTVRGRSVGRARFSLAAAHQRALKVRVSAAGRRLLSHARRVAGKDAITAHDGAGHARTTAARVTIWRLRGARA